MAVATRKSEEFKAIEKRDASRNLITDNISAVNEDEFRDAKLVEKYVLSSVQQQRDNDNDHLIDTALKKIGAGAEFLAGIVALMLTGNGMDIEFQSSDHIWCVD
ncbi:MAG: hypothetical protein M1820_010364 [Bogoriella megaspora]|nr:MAG: hypothetical protein M1820_010364 [Bogoriella megaspora]